MSDGPNNIEFEATLDQGQTTIGLNDIAQGMEKLAQIVADMSEKMSGGFSTLDTSIGEAAKAVTGAGSVVADAMNKVTQAMTGAGDAGTRTAESFARVSKAAADTTVAADGVVNKYGGIELAGEKLDQVLREQLGIWAEFPEAYRTAALSINEATVAFERDIQAQMRLNELQAQSDQGEWLAMQLDAAIAVGELADRLAQEAAAADRAGTAAAMAAEEMANQAAQAQHDAEMLEQAGIGSDIFREAILANAGAIGDFIARSRDAIDAEEALWRATVDAAMADVEYADAAGAATAATNEQDTAVREKTSGLSGLIERLFMARDSEREFSESTGGSVRGLKSFGGGVGEFIALMAGFGVVNDATRALRDFGDWAMQGNISLEKFRMQLGILTGTSGESLQQLVNWTFTFGRTVPFTTTAVQQASITIASMGLNIQDVLPTLASIAAAVGTDIPTAAIAFLDAFKEDRFLMMQRQLRISKSDLEQFGLQVEKNGKVVQSTLLPALQAYAAAKFPNALKESMQTFSGMTSNLIDQFQQLAIQFGRPVFQEFKGVLSDLIQYVNNNRIAIWNLAQTIGTVLGNAIGGIVTGFKWFLTLILNNHAAMQMFVGLLAGFATGGLAALIVGFASLAGSVLSLMAPFLGVGMLVGRLAGIFLDAYNKAGPFRDAVQTLGVELGRLWQAVSPLLSAAWSTLSSGFANTAGAITNFLGSAQGYAVINNLNQAISNLTLSIQQPGQFLAHLHQSITDLGNDFGGFIARIAPFLAIFAGIGGAFLAAKMGLIAFSPAAVNAMGRLTELAGAGAGLGRMEALFGRFGLLASGAFKAVADGITGLPGALGGLYGLLREGVAGAEDFAQMFVEGAAGGVTTLMRAVGHFSLQAVLDPIGSLQTIAFGAIAGIRGVADGIISVGGAVRNVTMLAFTKGLGALKGALLDLLPEVTAAVAEFGAMAVEVAIAAAPFIAIGAVVAGVVLAFLYWWNTSKGFREAIKGLWGDVQMLGNTLKHSLGQVVKQLGDTFRSQLLPAWRELQHAFKEAEPILIVIGTVVIGGIIAALGVLIGVINGVLKALGPFLSGVIQIFGGVVRVIAGVINLVISYFVDFLRLLKDLFTGNWGALWKDAQNLFRDSWNAIKDIFGGIWSIIEGLFKSTIGTIFNLISGFVSGIINFFKHLFDELVGHSIVPDMIHGIINVFLKLPSEVLGIVGGFIAGVGKMFLKLLENIPIVGGLVKGIAHVVGAIGGVVGGVVGVVKGAVGAVVSTVGHVAGAVGHVAGAVAGAVGSTVGHFRNLAVQAAGQMISAENAVKHGVTNIAHHLTNGLKGIGHGLGNALGGLGGLFGGGGHKHVKAAMDQLTVDAQQLNVHGGQAFNKFATYSAQQLESLARVTAAEASKIKNPMIAAALEMQAKTYAHMALMHMKTTVEVATMTHEVTAHMGSMTKLARSEAAQMKGDVVTNTAGMRAGAATHAAAMASTVTTAVGHMVAAVTGQHQGMRVSVLGHAAAMAAGVVTHVDAMRVRSLASMLKMHEMAAVAARNAAAKLIEEAQHASDGHTRAMLEMKAHGLLVLADMHEKAVQRVRMMHDQMATHTRIGANEMIAEHNRLHSGVLGVLGKLASTAIGKAKEMADGMTAHLRGGATSATSAAQDIAKGVLGALGGLSGQMAKVGLNAADAMAGAIRGAAGTLASAAEYAGASAVSAMRGKLGIQSPSRVFRDIGHDTLEGMRLGIVDHTERVSVQVGESVNSILDSTRGALSRRMSVGGALAVSGPTGGQLPPISPAALVGGSGAHAQGVAGAGGVRELHAHLHIEGGANLGFALLSPAMREEIFHEMGVHWSRTISSQGPLPVGYTGVP